MLTALQDAATAVATRVAPAVVRIGRGGGRGAGIVIGEGLVLTNAHNLRGAQVTVTFADGRTETGDVAGSDVDGDLAVVRVDSGDVPAVDWAEGAAELGSPVFALVTTPFGPRLTFGLVSAVGQAFRGPGGRLLGGAFEHTAPLGRGSSGGPVVDADGHLLGLNTNRVGDGFYLALPADAELRAKVERLSRGEAPVRHRLGVALAPAPAARQLRRAVGLPERDGVLVRMVEEDSPAAAAGLRQGDLITAAAGREVRTPDDLFTALDGLAAHSDGADGEDESLALHVVRGTDELDVAVRFGVTGEQGAA